MSVLRRLSHAPEIGVGAMLVLLVLAVSAMQPRFFGTDTLDIVLLAIPLTLIAAVGQMMVIVARHIDLSVGSTLAFAAIVAGIVFREHPEWPLAIGFVIALGAGAILGLINGLMVAWFRLPSIIVTLGTLSLYRGLVFIVSGGRQIDPNHIPEQLIAMAQPTSFGAPWIVVIALSVTFAAWLLMQHTQLGRQIYALGSNPEAARLRGIKVGPLTILVFTICGTLAGLAGIIYAARFGYVNPGITGVGFEFVVIAAVVIGGTSIAGGVGTVMGTLIGVLLLGTVSVALPMLGVSGFWQSATYGAIILLALLIDRVVRRSST